MKAGEYKHWEFSSPSPELIALQPQEVYRGNAKILDIGCGGGEEAIFMAQCGFRVIGVDISSLLSESRKKEQKKPILSWIGEEEMFSSCR